MEVHWNHEKVVDGSGRAVSPGQFQAVPGGRHFERFYFFKLFSVTSQHVSCFLFQMCHEFSWNFMLFHACHEISWNSVKFHEKSCFFNENICFSMKFHEISCNFMRIYKNSQKNWKLMKKTIIFMNFHVFPWMFMTFHEFSWKIFCSWTFININVSVCFLVIYTVLSWTSMNCLDVFIIFHWFSCKNLCHPPDYTRILSVKSCAPMRFLPEFCL